MGDGGWTSWKVALLAVVPESNHYAISLDVKIVTWSTTGTCDSASRFGGRNSIFLVSANHLACCTDSWAMNNSQVTHQQNPKCMTFCWHGIYQELWPWCWGQTAHFSLWLLARIKHVCGARLQVNRMYGHDHDPDCERTPQRHWHVDESALQIVYSQWSCWLPAALL